MAHIDLDQTRGDIVIDSEFRERDIIKLVPGTTWDKDNKVWRAPLSWGSCIALRGVIGDTLTVGEDLAAWSWEVYNTRILPTEAMRSALEDASLMASEPKLYPFQRSGVSFLEAAGSALLADEMGSGKTIQLIRTVARKVEQGSLPVLVVAPNSMKYTWEKEFSVWASDLTVSVVNGTAAQRRKQIAAGSDVVIINWESLRMHSKLASFGSNALTEAEKQPKELNEIAWGTVIADEAHKAKDPKAKQTRALWAVSREARYRFAATGTPIANNPGELWSLMNFVSPADFPGKSKFVDRYCLLNWNAFGGMDIIGVKPATKEEFHKLIDSRMIRRVKDVVLPYLPPKVYSTRELTMDTKQRKAYNQMADRMLAEIEGGIIDATNPLSQLTRLSQFACAYAEMDDAGEVKLMAPSNKVEAMMDILEDTDEQVVVFAESRQLIELAEAAIKKAGISYGAVTGAISVPQRQASIERFQAGDLKVMLVTLGAGGEGITLTAARTAVFLQRSWSLVKNKQAEDRLHRPGSEQHESIEIIDLVSKQTMEEYRILKLVEKEDRLQEVVRDDELRAILKFRG